MTFVIAADGKFDLVTKYPISEFGWSSTAITDGDLLLLSVEHIYCIGDD